MAFSRLLRVLRQRFRSLLRKGVMDEELNKEFAFHFEQLVAENIDAGMTPQGARRAARKALGNVALLEEECRDQRRVRWLHDLAQDVRYGLRLLRWNPIITFFAITSVALGIGANTAILGIMERVQFGYIPIPNTERLVVIKTLPLPNPQQQTNNASVPDYLAWKERSRSFELMGVSLSNQQDFGLEENGTPAERVVGQAFSASLFATLGVQPILGRVFTEDEDEIENPAQVIVISHQLWHRRFGGDPNILQKSLRLSGQLFTVIGVMPEEFRFPKESEYWVPLAFNRFQLQGSARFFMVTALLKRGTTVAEAQADLDAIAEQMAKDSPGRHQGWGVRVQTLRDFWFGWTRQPLVTLEGAVVLMLLIACANVATLLLARGSARSREFATRAALGAGRARILRQLFTECVLLSTLGGAAGLLVASVGLKILVAMTPPPGALPIAQIGLDSRMLGVALLSSILVGLIFGMAPAFGGFSHSIRHTQAGSSRHDLRGVLVAVQIGLALVLLAGSGLLINSFIRLVGTDRNYDPLGVLSFEFRIPLQQYLKGLGTHQGLPINEVSPPTLTMQTVYERLRALPGAESVAGISFPPINSLVLPTMSFLVEGRSLAQNSAAGDGLSAVYFLVTPNFFKTMKTSLVQGRDFDAGDTATAPWVAVINEAAALRFWPDEDPIGKRLVLDVVSGEQPREVVGVVRNIPLRHMRASEDPIIYASYLQQPERYRGPSGNMFGQMTFLIRTSGNPLNMVSAARKAVAAVDPDRPIANIQTMKQVTDSVRERGYYALGLGVFAFTALLLAAIGVYGVTAYAVAQRTREIGIRIALGATAGGIIYLVGGRAFLLIVSGLLLGLAGAFAFTHLLSSQLWGVTPTDPLTLAGVCLLLVFVALLACLIPVRRAIRVDPTEALRIE